MQCIWLDSHHIIFTFELFEGGFNSDKFLEKLKSNLKFIKQA